MVRLTRSRLDVAAACGLAAIAAAYVSWVLGGREHIYEDAAMLFRYAAHLAGGHGIVWNVGDAPLDGGTDFAFLIALAVLHRTGLSIEHAASLLGVAAHAATVVLVYWTIVRRGHDRLAAGASALYLAVGPAKAYVAAGFGTAVFAFGVAVAWTIALEWADSPDRTHGARFGAAVVAMGICRPEGVLLGALMAAGVIVCSRPSRAALVAFLSTATILGGAFFAARWWYFGAPLPNPYYKKGGFALHWDSFRASLKYGVLLGGPFWLALAAGFTSPATWRRAALAAIPACGFIASWILLSNEMNFFRRFQYPMLPLLLMSWPDVVAPLRHRFSEMWASFGTVPRRVAVAAMSVTVAAILAYQHATYMPPLWEDGADELGRMLAPYRDRGYAMAVSEAGVLPFYSGWYAIDTWGLNDRWIARHRGISSEYLDRRKPELIAFHAQVPLASARPTDEWMQMDVALQRYASSRSYTLAGQFGSTPDNTTYYYVREDVHDSGSITRVIRDWASRHRFTNFAAADDDTGFF